MCHDEFLYEHNVLSLIVVCLSNYQRGMLAVCMSVLREKVHGLICVLCGCWFMVVIVS